MRFLLSGEHNPCWFNDLDIKKRRVQVLNDPLYMHEVAILWRLNASIRSSTPMVWKDRYFGDLLCL
jgi:hypothetical protein